MHVTAEGIKWNQALYVLNHFFVFKLLKQGNPIKSSVSSRITVNEYKVDE